MKAELLLFFMHAIVIISGISVEDNPSPPTSKYPEIEKFGSSFIHNLKATVKSTKKLFDMTGGPTIRTRGDGSFLGWVFSCFGLFGKKKSKVVKQREIETPEMIENRKQKNFEADVAYIKKKNYSVELTHVDKLYWMDALKRVLDERIRLKGDDRTFIKNQIDDVLKDENYGRAAFEQKFQCKTNPIL